MNVGGGDVRNGSGSATTFESGINDASSGAGSSDSDASSSESSESSESANSVESVDPAVKGDDGNLVIDESQSEIVETEAIESNSQIISQSLFSGIPVSTHDFAKTISERDMPTPSHRQCDKGVKTRQQSKKSTA